MNAEKVVGVIVAYHPSLDRLNDLLLVLRPQVDAVVVVDNGSPESFRTWLSGRMGANVQGIFLEQNFGIAAAQNTGIRWARVHGATHVLLLDQDSWPAVDMVAKLLDAARKKAGAYKVAAVGPRFLDERRQNPPPFTRVQGVRIRRQNCDDVSSVVPVDYLIASGCLIPMSVLDKVGDMRDELFIDYVDIEWGLRAHHHGFQSYGVCSAHMQHSLGDHPIPFFGKSIPVHSPLRHYFHFRNAMLLYKEPWVPLNWKLVDGLRLCFKYVFYSLFAKPRMSHWHMMTLGIWHGLVGKAGKFEGVES